LRRALLNYAEYCDGNIIVYNDNYSYLLTAGGFVGSATYDKMRLFESATHGGTPTLITPAPTGTHSNSNGANAEDSDFRRRDIWQNDASASGTTPAAHHGLGFNSAHWDFSTVNTHGHPVLRASPNGPRMGGQ